MKEKKCFHPVLKVAGEICGNCGWIEGGCNKCGKYVAGYAGQELEIQ